MGYFVMLGAERDKKLRVVILGDCETLLMVEILCRFDAVWDRAFLTIFLLENCFYFNGDVAAFCRLDVLGDFFFCLPDFFLAVFQKFLDEFIHIVTLGVKLI